MFAQISSLWLIEKVFFTWSSTISTSFSTEDPGAWWLPGWSGWWGLWGWDSQEKGQREVQGRWSTWGHLPKPLLYIIHNGERAVKMLAYTSLCMWIYFMKVRVTLFKNNQTRNINDSWGFDVSNSFRMRTRAMVMFDVASLRWSLRAVALETERRNRRRRQPPWRIETSRTPVTVSCPLSSFIAFLMARSTVECIRVQAPDLFWAAVHFVLQK